MVVLVVVWSGWSRSALCSVVGVYWWGMYGGNLELIVSNCILAYQTVSKRIIMIKKIENCIYCGEKMESITAKKRYCSAKCKLYYNREKNKVKRGAPFKNMPPYDENSGGITIEFKKLDKIAAKLGVSKPKADVGNKFYKEPVELTLNRQPEPPDGLKGIDLVIWKSENWK